MTEVIKMNGGRNSRTKRLLVYKKNTDTNIISLLKHKKKNNLVEYIFN